MKLTTGRWVKIVLSLVLVVSLVPLMGSTGCRGNPYYGGFDYGYGYYPTGGGYYGGGYQETYFETGFYYEDSYYGGGYFDDWWWKNKNADKSQGVKLSK